MNTGITALTPTGDRPLAFALCRQWMLHQTVRPDQWIVVNDGKTPLEPMAAMQYVRREPRPDDPKHTLLVNLKTAVPLIKGNKIVIIEDDEYYAPGYVEEVARRLDQHEVVGINHARFYHLPSGGYCTNANARHASLAQTSFRRSFLPAFSRLLIGDMFLDKRIWGAAGNRGHLFSDNDDPLYLGMKGMPGRIGISVEHGGRIYRVKDSAKRDMLKRWVPRGYQIYLDILNGKLTENNCGVYFQQGEGSA